MADHTDFIRIRGLESSADEVFQGLGAAPLTVESGTPGGNTAIDWGEIPEDTLTMISEYSQSLNDWIAQAIRYDEDSGSRSLVPELMDDLPVVPMALATVATGGLSLPAVASTMLAQVLMNQVGTAVANYAEAHDVNSPINILKKAFLHDNNEKSILGTALLNESEESILEERLTGIQEGVEDLTFIDAEVKYADNTSLHVKGKVLNH